MINKPLQEVIESDLQDLKTQSIEEGKLLDYKKEMYGVTGDEKKELLADISSFANTEGGDLLIGIEETAGVPTAIDGVEPSDVDAETLRLENIIRSGLEPRAQVDIRAVPLANSKHVFIVRVMKSLIGPHRVNSPRHGKFFARNSGGKYSMDVSELRTAFTLGSSVAERIRDFRMDRIAKISSNGGHIRLSGAHYLVIHVVPIRAFTTNVKANVHRYYHEPGDFPPIHRYSYSRRINLDGVVSYGGGKDTTYCYTQIYRSGIVEAVDSMLIEREDADGHISIPSDAYEKNIINYLPVCMKWMNDLDITGPFSVYVTLVNVKGAVLMVDQVLTMGDNIVSYGENVLYAPEIVAENSDIDAATLLKPAFDTIWNAFGYTGSYNYNDQGIWSPR